MNDIPRHGASDVAARTQDAFYPKAVEHVYSRVSNIVTMSFGIATLIPQIRVDSKDLLKAADVALYQAKSEGKNCVRSYVFTLD